MQNHCASNVNNTVLLLRYQGFLTPDLFQKIYASHLDLIVEETPQKVGKIVNYGFLLAVGFSFLSPLLRPLCLKKRLKNYCSDLQLRACNCNT